ncbi:hypothetical protein DFQ28_000777 [Apophysomyces sp. BC1034]|nr:hypothetical protein DFQ28_000777 [Apophysomyces sp. BC1034]
MADEESEPLHGVQDITMTERELGLIIQPNLVWTPTKYKTEQVAQFIAIIQNDNVSIADAARRSYIKYDAAYKFHKQWRDNGGTVLPGNAPASDVKRKVRNQKLNDDHSAFLERYVKGNPTCIVKDVAASLCDAFENLTVNDSTVYRHITYKLSFSLTRT